MERSYGNKTWGDELVIEFAPHIKGKVIMTTGVSQGGLGSAFVEAIAKGSPKLLILANRDTSKAEATAAKIKEIAPGVDTRTLKLDLGSFKSVRKAAEEVNAYSEAIDVLVNNAGIMGVPYKKTEDGLEAQFQTNHLSHFLFTNLILDKILGSRSDPRIINISSDGYRLSHIRYFDYNFHDGESYNPWTAYGQSKSANILFSRELAKRLEHKGLTSISLHPGVIWTNLPKHGATEEFSKLTELDKMLGNPRGWQEIKGIEPNQGIAPYVYASFAPRAKDFNGQFMNDMVVIPTPIENLHPWVVGELESRKCWKLSEKLVGQEFNF